MDLITSFGDEISEIIVWDKNWGEMWFICWKGRRRCVSIGFEWCVRRLGGHDRLSLDNWGSNILSLDELTETKDWVNFRRMKFLSARWENTFTFIIGSMIIWLSIRLFLLWAQNVILNPHLNSKRIQRWRRWWRWWSALSRFCKESNQRFSI